MQTNEDSGIRLSERNLKKLQGAEVVKGLSIHGAEAAQSEKQVAEWTKISVK